MKFKKTKLNGEQIIIPEKLEDERGYFSRVYDEKVFAKKSLNINWVQANKFFSEKKGTLRGLTYQTEPKEEVKLITCTRGEIFDVALDLRKGSDTFGKYTGVILSPENGKMHYIPKGFAHGYITLKDTTVVNYLVSQYYSPEYAKGVRWDDKKFAIDWPIEPQVISEKDKNYPSHK